MNNRKIVHTTVTGQPPADEGRDFVPTRDELWRPASLDRPKKPGKLDMDIQLSPEMLQFLLDQCERLDLRLSDCTFYSDGRVEIPNQRRGSNAR